MAYDAQGRMPVSSGALANRLAGYGIPASWMVGSVRIAIVVASEFIIVIVVKLR